MNLATRLAQADPVTYISSSGNTQLIVAALAAIATIVVLITVVKLHPFIGLLLGSAVLALVAWVPGPDAIKSFTTGFGNTSGAVGLLIALGAMLGQILADSGGADRVVATISDRFSGSALPWGMALIAAIIGLPMFFEIGVVILVPIVLLVARRTRQPLMRIGIPALAGLSILHGLVPPHPGPETAIAALHADQGRTLIFGLIVAVPTLIVAGPLLGRFIDRLVPLQAPALAGGGAAVSPESGNATASPDTSASGYADDANSDLAADSDADRPGGLRNLPAFGKAVIVVLIPVLLMLPSAIVNLFVSEDNMARKVLNVLGTPSVALLIAVVVAYFVLGLGTGMTREKASESLGRGLPGIAGIMLIVAAGGGFKQLLVDTGVGKVIADWATGANISVLVLGWLVAVGIRLATGSATVATVTAAGIVGSLAAGLSTTHLSLLVLAIGCGSLFFSHVNDAGFWLVKEYFGLTVGQTLKSWSLMETVISVFGFGVVMLLSVIFT